MSNEVIRFEQFELDGGAFELRREGRVVHLERIPLEVLLLLANRPGTLVEREEILERIWGKDVFVDADNSINTAVRKIRQALKDNPDEPRFVQTVPGKGYRFAGRILTVPPTNPALPHHTNVVGPEVAPTATERGEARKSSKQEKPSRWGMRAGIAVLLVAVAVVIGLYFSHRPTGRATKTMMAVLPFVNLSGDPDQEYLADGMTEEMISDLGSLDPEHLGVIARTSSMQYKNAKKGASQIARELGVNYLLEGSVRLDGQRVRVTAQLIQASDETHVWASNFDRESKDVLKLQSDVALAIAQQIKLSLEGPVRARLAGTPTVNPEAHEAYLRGLHASDLRTKEGVQEAISEFERAVAIDPNYAAAFAALGRILSLASVPGTLPEKEAMPRARDAAQRAIALDDSLSEGHTVLGFVRAHYEFDWPGAEREYRRGLEMNPNDAYAHFFYSNSYLSPLGRHEEAVAEMGKAITLDPFSPPVRSFLGRTYLWARRYDDALKEFNKCAELFPGFAIDRERLAHLYTYTGRFEEAIAEETKARLLAGEEPKSVLQKEEALRKALKEGGARGYWKQVLEFSRAGENAPESYAGSYGLAIIYARMGEKDKALDALEAAYEERARAMTEIGIEPALDSLRGEPRFQVLMQRVGLAK